MRIDGTEVELIEIKQQLVEGVGRYATTVRVNRCITGKSIMKIEDTGFPELDGKEVYLFNGNKCVYCLTYLMPLINWKFERK